MVVLHSRYAPIKELVNAIVQAQEVYYLANGYYASSYKNLDIQLPPGNDESTDTEAKYLWGFC